MCPGLLDHFNDLLGGDTYKELSDKYLLDAEKIWKPYRLLVSPLVYAEYFDEDLDEVQLVKKLMQRLLMREIMAMNC